MTAEGTGITAADISSDTHKAILRAVCDPGSITSREPDESLPHWQTRAVEEFAAPYIAAAEQERIRQRLLEAARPLATVHLCEAMLDGRNCGGRTFDGLVGGAA